MLSPKDYLYGMISFPQPHQINGCRIDKQPSFLIGHTNTTVLYTTLMSARLNAYVRNNLLLFQSFVRKSIEPYVLFVLYDMKNMNIS